MAVYSHLYITTMSTVSMVVARGTGRGSLHTLQGPVRTEIRTLGSSPLGLINDVQLSNITGTSLVFSDRALTALVSKFCLAPLHANDEGSCHVARYWIGQLRDSEIVLQIVLRLRVWERVHAGLRSFFS